MKKITALLIGVALMLAAGSAMAIQIDGKVPEPGTMMLLGVGMFVIAIYFKRRMNKEA